MRFHPTKTLLRPCHAPHQTSPMVRLLPAIGHATPKKTIPSWVIRRREATASKHLDWLGEPETTGRRGRRITGYTQAVAMREKQGQGLSIRRVALGGVVLGHSGQSLRGFSKDSMQVSLRVCVCVCVCVRRDACTPLDGSRPSPGHTHLGRRCQWFSCLARAHSPSGSLEPGVPVMETRVLLLHAELTIT